ncbi:diadenylate cyclase [Planctomycetota bacterium]
MGSWLVDYLGRVASNNHWWAVAIQLLLIGLVVYWVVDFLEGTRGERLFRGVLFLLVAGVLVLNLLTQRLEYFDQLRYLYKGFLIAVLIIAVAAFQPEIRRVLIRIGEPRIWSDSPKQFSRTAEEVVAAARELSAGKIGAIVVLERQVALGEFIETGVRLDARVTAELLKTIFYPGTCLHDMAVIIRGDRIVAARVQLPLAEAALLYSNEQEDAVAPFDRSSSELGSRHRAAIGIAMGSDAVCVVVSEESGAISVAQDGQLRRNITESQLRSQLVGSASKRRAATPRTSTGHLSQSEA